MDWHNTYTHLSNFTFFMSSEYYPSSWIIEQKYITLVLLQSDYEPGYDRSAYFPIDQYWYLLLNPKSEHWRNMKSKTRLLIFLLYWATYLGLCFISGWFASGVVENYVSRKTSFSQKEEVAIKRPVITIEIKSENNSVQD